MYEEEKRESERDRTHQDGVKQTGTNEAPENAVKNTQTRNEAWKNSPRIKSASQTLLESGAGRVKQEITGVKSPNQDTIKTQKGPSQATKNISTSPQNKTHQESKGDEKPNQSQRQSQRQLTSHKLIQPAASTSSITGGERKNPLNVKRVSSSGDVTRGARHGPRASTAAPGRGAGGLGGPKIHSGVPGSRRLSGNAGGRGKGGELGAEEVGKPKEQRPSLPTGDKIRLPSARGEKGLPTLPPEASGGRSGVNRQGNADDKPSSGSPKTKPLGKHRSLVESSPYAVSTIYTTNNTLWMIVATETRMSWLCVLPNTALLHCFCLALKLCVIL